MAVTYLDVGPVMSVASFDPYVSEFEFASKFHPSNNPDCMNRWSSDSEEGNDEFMGDNFEYQRSRRSPEEGSPVGQEPSIEVRTILVRCPRNEEETDDILINRNIYNITAGRSQDILDFHGFDRDEPSHHSEVRDCRRKLIITMKFNNIGRTKTQEEFVVIDHVLDPVTMHKSRLLNPFVVKVRQEPVLQLYGLKFQGVVNAEAREEVLNKKLSNYTGCDNGSENPTCGQMIFEDKPIPYSQGFCCSCDSELNIQRQSSLLNESVDPPFSSFFSRSKHSPIRAYKSPRSVNENVFDDRSDLEETSQDAELFDNSKKPNSDHGAVFFENNNATLAKNSDDEEADLINLKNLSRMPKENQKTLDARKIQGSAMSANDKSAERHQMAFHNPDRINIAAELMKLEEEYKNLRMSNLIRAEGQNDDEVMTETQKIHPSAVKASNKIGNDNRADNFVPIGRIQDKLAPKVDRDRHKLIPTSSYAEKMPFLDEGHFNDQMPTLSIDVLFAIKPKYKSTTCPINSTIDMLTTCPTDKLTTQSVVQNERPTVLRQKIINDRVYPSSTENSSYSIDQRREAGNSNSMKARTDLSRKFDANIGESLKNVAISGDAEIPNGNQAYIGKSRLRKMNNATSTENSTTISPDTETESRVSSEGTTENLQHTVDPNQSFDNLSSQVESLANSSSSFSSGNHSKNDAILLSGSLQNQLANWFSYDKGRKFGRRRGEKKSMENVGQKSEIGYGKEVGFFGMKISTPAADNLINGRRYEVQMTTTTSFRRPVQIYLKTDYNSDRHVKEKNIGSDSDPEDVDLLVLEKSEPPNVPRSYRSIDSDNVFNKDNDHLKNIDKKIEDMFMDISEASKNDANDHTIIREKPNSENIFEKDNSVIEKIDIIVNDVAGRKSMMKNDLPIQSDTIESPETLEGEVEVEIIKPRREFVGNKIPEPKRHDIPVDKLVQKKIGRPKILRQNLAKDVNEADATRISKLSPFFGDMAMRESASTANLEHDQNEIQSEIVKHTEVSIEPVSEIPLTTEHQIIVDRFKIVNTFTKLPKNYEQLMKETIQNRPSNVTPKIEDTTSFHTNKRNTETVSENILTLVPKTVEEFRTGTTLQTIAVVNDTSSMKNDTSLHSILSPVLMIENLKNELRKEAERYAASPFQGASLNSRGLQGHSNFVQEVREVNTQLTPAEKVEDMITDEETLPPDEETGFTTKSLSKTTIMSSTVSSSTINDLEKMNYTLLPRRAFQDSEISLRHKKHSQTSSSLSSLQLRRKRTHKKRNHHKRHHHHRISRHKRRSFTENSNSVEPKSKSGKVHVSLFRIPESDHHSKLAGFRVEEIPKSEAPVESNVDVVNTSMISQSFEASKMRDVDKIPTFQHTGRSSLDDESKSKKSLMINRNGSEFIRKMRNSKGAKKKFKALSKPKFRSIYPKSDEIDLISEEVVDEMTGRNDIGRQSKRDDLKKFDESQPEALIFYDYDAIDSPTAAVTEDQDDENKRSLDNLEKKNGDEFKLIDKSALQQQKKRSYLMSGNETKPREVVMAERSTLLSKKWPRSMNMSDDQFRIEPSGGWKAKMELLKLKKHADVLKEYLNWRHDILPPEPIGISGYTTKISMTTEKDEGITKIITTQQFSNVSNGTTLISTSLTSSSVHDDISTTIQPYTDFRTLTTSNNDDHVTQETFMSIFPESSSISLTTNFLENRSLSETNTTDEIEISTGNLHLETQENSSYGKELSTGRILPPCCPTIKNVVTTCSAGLHGNIDDLSGRPYSSEIPKPASNGIPNNSEQLSDIKNDLVIISIMEKNRSKNKNIVKGKNGHKDSPKIYRIHEEGVPISHHRHHKSKNKIGYPISVISKKSRSVRRPGRRLMSIEDLDYKNDDEEGDSMFDDYEVNEESSVDGNLDAIYHDHTSGKLEDKWDKLIDKIIHTNSSEFWAPENSTEAQLPERPDDDRSALKQLHFRNADKYIREMARKIVHNSNIRITNLDLDRNVDKNRVGRKLQSYPRLNRRKRLRKIGTKNTKVFGNNVDSINEKRSASGLRFKMEDSYNDPHDSSASEPNSEHQNPDSNVTSYEMSDQNQYGRDFAISLSGKIHVEGGTNGRPISISFDTSPEVSNNKEIVQSKSNGTSDVDNSTNTETTPSANFLSSLFNIASDPKNLARHSQKTDDNLNSNISGNRSARMSGNNDRQNLPHLSKKSIYIRKSRAIDQGHADRFQQYRDERSFNFEDSQNLEDTSEDSASGDYRESRFAGNDDYQPEEDDDSKLQLLEQKNINSRHFSSDIKSDLSNDPHYDYSPDIKVLKVIPLNGPSSVLRTNNEPNEKKEDTKASRMIASQLPKMKNDLLEETVKPGKIKPAELPQENEVEDDKNLVQDIDASQKNSRASASSSTVSGSAGKNQEQNTIDGTKNSISNLDANYEIVPLIHLKIEQQISNKHNPEHNYVPPENPNILAENIPSERMEKCPKMEITKTPHFHGDDSCSYPDINDGTDKIEDNDNRDQPEVSTMNMDNDEELREPSGIGSCPEFNQQDGLIIPSSSEDDKLDQIHSTQKSFGDHQEITTHKAVSNKLSERERIRLLNMLAIMEFIKKIKAMISDEGTQMANMDDNNAVINLASIVILPINRSETISGKAIEDNEKRPEIKQHNSDTSLNANNNLKDSRSDTSNWKTVENQNNGDFFNGNNDKTETVKQTDSKDLKYRDFPSSMDNRNFIDHSNEGYEETKSHEGPKEIQERNTELPDIDKSMTNNSTNNSVDIPNNLPKDHEVLEDKSRRQENESKESDILQNLRQKLDKRVNENLARDERQDSKSSSKKERSVEPDFSPVEKIKRHRLRSIRTQLRDPRRQSYKSRSLPNGGEISRSRNEKSRRLAAGKGISKGKRRRKKKKKRRKKKKHKKKKGKNLRDAEIKGKSWWPFGRQLMSLSDQRELISDKNVDQDEIEEIQIKNNKNRRDVVPLEHRKRRRVHRAKHPHGKKKKMKKRRKHKKVKKKKKKKKGKKSKKMGLRNKRQVRPGGNQVRGGQDCMDRRHPPNVNPAKYLESAHCLRFSDLWYSVYEMENPIMEHTVYLQLFEKHNRADSTTHWEDLTQGSMVRMGTFTRHQRDSTPTIVFTYSGAKIEPQNRALNLDPSRQRLLVPSPVPPKKASDYPEIRGGSGEYLVVPTKAISKDGNECDKAGVGFAAFSKQQDRCDRPMGSCLKNQPLDYWRHDMEARESGRPGCYFLSNFASVPSKPIKYNVSGSGSREYLGLEYHSTHVSAIDIQVRSDYNAIVRVGSSGRVTEVYVDSTALEHTVVTVVISNMGLASSPYQPRITDCPTGLPVSWTKAKGIMQVIPPQHDQRVTLDLYGQLLLNEFHCSVEVVNHRGELVAMRRIRVKKMDRCFCVWHCLCACIGSVNGMGCTPMSPEHYHAAGFQGPVPVVTTETSILMNGVKNVLMLSALFVLLLLFLGILKWFIGIFTPAVGRWGLDSLLEGSRIDEYLEPELKCRCVMTDDDGWPVHPDTGQRTVKFCSRKFEFFLNLIFFLTYPIAVCCNYCKRSLNSSRQRHCCPDESKMCLINEKGSCPKMICVSTYGDNRNTKLEAEDTRYVMNELKKSQESLQNPKRSKKKSGYENLKNLSNKNKSAADVNAKKLVHDLLSSRVVFRNLTEPIGGLRISSGTTYSLRGYFLNDEDGGYRFITPCPFKQYWLIENNQKVASIPPETYPSNLFMRSFGTVRDVYESNELSLKPKGMCINVQYQEDT